MLQLSQEMDKDKRRSFEDLFNHPPASTPSTSSTMIKSWIRGFFFLSNNNAQPTFPKYLYTPYKQDDIRNQQSKKAKSSSMLSIQ